MKSHKALKAAVVSTTMAAVVTLGLWTTSATSFGGVTGADPAVTGTSPAVTPPPQVTEPSPIKTPKTSIADKPGGTCNYCGVGPESATPK